VQPCLRLDSPLCSALLTLCVCAVLCQAFTFLSAPVLYGCKAHWANRLPSPLLNTLLPEVHCTPHMYYQVLVCYGPSLAGLMTPQPPLTPPSPFYVVRWCTSMGHAPPSTPPMTPSKRVRRRTTTTSLALMQKTPPSSPNTHKRANTHTNTHHHNHTQGPPSLDT
jgi:hypothetical protein